MPVRRSSLASILVLTAAVAVALAQPQVTVVLTNGQQYTGTLVAQNNNIGLISLGGQRISWPQRNIAVIEFTPGDPDQQELQQVSSLPGSQGVLSRVLTTSSTAAVLQDGQIISGRLAAISNDGNQITIITSDNQRNSYTAADIARLYLNPSAARNAFAMTRQQQPGAVGTTGRIGPDGVLGQVGTISVPANQPWTPTGIHVHQGDRLAFRATGQIHWGPQAADIAGPQGARGISQNYPVPTAGVGALIGRVGNSQPFVLSSNGATVTMPADGQLMLGINDDLVSDNSGSYQVQIARSSGN